MNRAIERMQAVSGTAHTEPAQITAEDIAQRVRAAVNRLRWMV